MNNNGNSSRYNNRAMNRRIAFENMWGSGGRKAGWQAHHSAAGRELIEQQRATAVFAAISEDEALRHG